MMAARRIALKDTLVVITGGAGHLALACARRFSEHRLLLSDTNPSRLEAAVQTLRSEGSQVTSMVADITTVAGANDIALSAKHLGGFCTLIHAAGVSPPTPPETIMAVNLFGTLNVLQAFTPLVQANVKGIVLASLAAHRRLAVQLDDLTLDPKGAPGELTQQMMQRFPMISPSRLAYAVSKRGTVLQVKKYALLWAQAGARLVSVSPGIIADTAMGIQRGPKAPAASDGEHEVRHGLSTEIAAAVWLAASAEASLLNGTDILVDGGYLATIDTAYPQSKRDDWHELRI